MGYANVFWINEAPIRTYLSANSRDEDIAKYVGEAVLDLTADDTFRKEPHKNATGLLNETAVLNSVGSFHSNDFVAVIWTGNRLVKFPNLTAQDFEFLVKLDELSKSNNFIPPLSSYQRKVTISRYEQTPDYKHDNPLLNSGEVSIYWIYEDFTRTYRRMPKEEWHTKEVGDAVLDLMLDVWHSSSQILNHGNAVSKVGTLIKSEFAIFVWKQNWLQRISEIDEVEQAKILEWLNEP